MVSTPIHVRSRKGDRVSWRVGQADPFEICNLFKYELAIGKLFRINWASECHKRCCRFRDWHYNAICSAVVWWTWPNGETSLGTHKWKFLKLEKEKK